MRKLLFALPFILVAGCGETDPTTAKSTEPDPTPQIDTDPTPQSGTGGDTQFATPDTTVNGAPGAKPMNNQPTPSDN